MDNPTPAAGPLAGQVVLITGGARRVGRSMALACAAAGADVAVHHGHSRREADEVVAQVRALGRRAVAVQADLARTKAVSEVVARAAGELGPLTALVNSASVFESMNWRDTTLAKWQENLDVNLTAPLLLSQAFAEQCQPVGRIVNILDWVALRPQPQRLPYTVSKAGLAALTQALAIDMAPDVVVNGLALGAILPPADGGDNAKVIAPVPMRRWAQNGEVEEALVFLLSCSTYITGEILHVDGGRHLV